MSPLVIVEILIILSAVSVVGAYIFKWKADRELEKFKKDFFHLDMSMGCHVEPDRDAISGCEYGEPILFPAFSSMELSQIMDKARKGVLPKTPKTCLNCGAKYKGGATAPGDDMKLDLRVFYNCGASIALREDENGQHVMLKNCVELKRPVVKYPILCGRLVKTHHHFHPELCDLATWHLSDNGHGDRRFKTTAGTLTRDDNPLAERVRKQREFFKLEVDGMDGSPNKNGDDFSEIDFSPEGMIPGNRNLLPRSEIDKATQEVMDCYSPGGSQQENVLFVDKAIREMTVHVDPGTAEPTVFSIGRPDCPIPLKHDVLIPGRVSGIVSTTKMKHCGESVVRSLTKSRGKMVADSIISLKEKLEALGINPQIVLLAKDAFEELALHTETVPLGYYRKAFDGLVLVPLNNLPERSVYVTTREEAQSIINGLSKPAGGKPSVEAMNKILHEQYDKEEESGH